LGKGNYRSEKGIRKIPGTCVPILLYFPCPRGGQVHKEHVIEKKGIREKDNKK